MVPISTVQKFDSTPLVFKPAESRFLAFLVYLFSVLLRTLRSKRLFKTKIKLYENCVK